MGIELISCAQVNSSQIWFVYFWVKFTFLVSNWVPASILRS